MAHAVRSTPPKSLTVDVAHAVDAMDADRWVQAYIRLLMRLEGARASADATREAS